MKTSIFQNLFWGILSCLNVGRDLLEHKKTIFGQKFHNLWKIRWLKKGVAHAKSDKNGAFWSFWAICYCLIDSRVVYSVSTHENLSYGTKFKSLWPFGGNLWPKIGQIYVPKAGRRWFLDILTTTKWLKWSKCVSILLYSLRQVF